MDPYNPIIRYNLVLGERVEVLEGHRDGGGEAGEALLRRGDDGVWQARRERVSGRFGVLGAILGVKCSGHKAY
jgi:hypothetical protein